MNLRVKIEAEIKRLEESFNDSDLYKDIKECEEKLAYLKSCMDFSPPYKTLQTLKNLLQEDKVVDTTEYKILDIDRLPTKRGRTSKHENKLPDTSHYKELLDYVELYLEANSGPQVIGYLHRLVIDGGYEVGGKNPPYTLSAMLSKDPRFTATNNGWVLTKEVKSNAV